MARCGAFFLRAHLHQHASYFAPVNLHVVWKFNRGRERKFVVRMHVRNGFDRPGSELRGTCEVDPRSQKNRKPKSFPCRGFPSIAALTAPGEFDVRRKEPDPRLNLAVANCKIASFVEPVCSSTMISRPMTAQRKVGLQFLSDQPV